MARADLIINLVKTNATGDSKGFRKTLEALITEERAKRHHGLAERLSQYLAKNNETATASSNLVVSGSQASNLYAEITPERELKSLQLAPTVLTACNELIEEQHRADLLRSYNIEPRNRVLLAGPPGNGKTSLAEALANELMIPLYQVRYDGLIGSYLGETAQRLRRLFDHTKTRRCVLFFDEFDAIGKERGDTHETGEIKRVVSSLLLQIDDIPSHVIVIVASNHPELLDRAVWRRFQIRLQLSPPTPKEIEKWFKSFFQRFDTPYRYPLKTLADNLKDLSYAELEDFGLDIIRRHILNQPDSNLRSIVTDRLKQHRAKYKTPNTRRLKK